MILNNFYSEHFSSKCARNRAKDNFTFVICAYGGHLDKNGNNSWTINAWCMQLVLIESPNDFEQLLFQAFFSYLFKKYGQEQYYIGNMRLWRPSRKMAVTFEPLTLESCNWHWQKALMILNNFYSRHFSPICSRNRARDIFTFILCAYGGHFENGRHVRQRSNPRWVHIQICS